MDWKYELHDFYKTLLSLRKAKSALVQAMSCYNLPIQYQCRVKYFRFCVKMRAGEVLVLLNF